MRSNGSFLSPRARPSSTAAKGVWGLREAFHAQQNYEWPAPTTNYVVSANARVYGGSSAVSSISSGTFPTSVGESIAVFVVWYDTTSVTVTVSDSSGDTYTSATVASSTGSIANAQWFYCLNVGTSNPTNTITVTFSTAQGYATAQFIKLTGGVLKSFDVVANAATSSSASFITRSSFNTAGAGIVLAGRAAYNAQTSTSWSTGYTAIDSFPTSLLYSSTAQQTFASAQTGLTVTETGNSNIARALSVLALK